MAAVPQHHHHHQIIQITSSADGTFDPQRHVFESPERLERHQNEMELSEVNELIRQQTMLTSFNMATLALKQERAIQTLLMAQQRENNPLVQAVQTYMATLAQMKDTISQLNAAFEQGDQVLSQVTSHLTQRRIEEAIDQETRRLITQQSLVIATTSDCCVICLGEEGVDAFLNECRCCPRRANMHTRCAASLFVDSATGAIREEVRCPLCGSRVRRVIGVSRVAPPQSNRHISYEGIRIQ